MRESAARRAANLADLSGAAEALVGAVVRGIAELAWRAIREGHAPRTRVPRSEIPLRSAASDEALLRA
jgi:hypothetical protein